MKKMWLSNWLQRNESWGLNQKWVTFKQYKWKSNTGLMKEPDEYLPWQLGIGVCECGIWHLDEVSERWVIVGLKLKAWTLVGNLMKVRTIVKLKVLKWCEILSEIKTKQRLKRCENSRRIQNQNNIKSFKCWTPVNLILEVWLDKSIRCWELEESAVFAAAAAAAAAAVWVRFLLSVVLVEKGSWDIIMWINNVVGIS